MAQSCSNLHSVIQSSAAQIEENMVATLQRDIDLPLIEFMKQRRREQLAGFGNTQESTTTVNMEETMVKYMQPNIGKEE